jgi:hypothetical protein
MLCELFAFRWTGTLSVRETVYRGQGSSARDDEANLSNPQSNVQSGDGLIA